MHLQFVSFFQRVKSKFTNIFHGTAQSQITLHLHPTSHTSPVDLYFTGISILLRHTRKFYILKLIQKKTKTSLNHTGNLTFETHVCILGHPAFPLMFNWQDSEKIRKPFAPASNFIQ